MIESRRYQAGREAVATADRMLADFRAGLESRVLDKSDLPRHRALCTLSSLYLHGMSDSVREGMLQFDSFSRGLLYLEAEEGRRARISAVACGQESLQEGQVGKAYLLARLGERDKALELGLQESWAPEQQALVYAALGEPEWAAEQMQHELPAAPVTLMALEEMILRFAQKGDYTKTGDWLAVFHRLADANDQAGLLFVLDAYLPGLKVLERGLALAEDLSSLRLQLTQAYLNLGKIGHAVEQASACEDEIMQLRSVWALKRWGRAQKEVTDGRPRIACRSFF